MHCYASTAWQMSCSKECLQRIFCFQKRAARIILDADLRTPYVLLFNRLQWLRCYVDTKIAQCCILYKRTQLAIPDYFIDSINLNSSRHTEYQDLFVLIMIGQQKVEERSCARKRPVLFWTFLTFPCILSKNYF